MRGGKRDGTGTTTGRNDRDSGASRRGRNAPNDSEQTAWNAGYEAAISDAQAGQGVGKTEAFRRWAFGER